MRSSGKHAPTNDKLEAHPMNPVAYDQSQQYNSPYQPQSYGAPQFNQQQPYDPPQTNYPQAVPQHYQGMEVNQGQAPAYASVSGQHYG